MPVSTPLPGQSGHHAVQFYSDDHKLCMSIADFLGDGLAAGQPCLLVGTPKHRDAIVRELKARHFDVDALIRGGDLVLHDAAATLARFMVDDLPDTERFTACVMPVLDGLRRGRSECVVRAFGEMVDVLWRSGNPEGAIRLEVLWNELASTQPFSLLCGYALGHFYQDTGRLQHVCDHHTHSEILRAGNA